MELRTRWLSPDISGPVLACAELTAAIHGVAECPPRIEVESCRVETDSPELWRSPEAPKIQSFLSKIFVNVDLVFDLWGRLFATIPIGAFGRALQSANVALKEGYGLGEIALLQGVDDLAVSIA